MLSFSPDNCAGILCILWMLGFRSTAPGKGIHHHMKYRIPEIRVSTIREVGTDRKEMNQPSLVADFCRLYFEMSGFDHDREHLLCLNLNSRLHLESLSHISTGTLDHCLVHPREVFRPAIVSNASSVLIVHNHPSGLCDPSQADIRITRELIKVGELIRIQVTDHVIFGQQEGEYRSLRELGYFYS